MFEVLHLKKLQVGKFALTNKKFWLIFWQLKDVKKAAWHSCKKEIMSLELAIYFLLFATIVYGIYLALPKKARPFCLLAFSVLFYVLYSKFLSLFLLATIVSVFAGGKWINALNNKFAKQKEGLEKEQRKQLKQKFARRKFWVVFLFVAFNLALLGVAKYFNFFGSVFEGFLSWFNISVKVPVLKLVLPLGISYYTLSAIGYLVDVNRGKQVGSFWEVALFLTYFPQLVEGPFARFDALSPQLMAGTGFDSKNFYGGILTILWGLFKKVVVADRLAIIVGAVFANYAQYGGIIIVFGILCFTFQLYAEFSGIIDIASGISEMFGIKLAPNFKEPFFSSNVSEFWRKWHISLGAWFKDYIFYPVSMSKGVTKLNKKMQGKVSSFFQLFVTSAITLFAVWSLNGLWHGAGAKYLVYGMYYYVLMLIGLLLEPAFKKLYEKLKISNSKALKILSYIKTFVLVNIGMLIFRADTLSIAWAMFAKIFSAGRVNLVACGVIDIHDLIMCFVGIGVLFAVDIIKAKNINIKQWFTRQHTAAKLAIIILIIVIVVVFGAYGQGYIAPDPIYGAF